MKDEGPLISDPPDPPDLPNDELLKRLSRRREEYLGRRTPMYTAEEITELRSATVGAPSLEEERHSGVVLAHWNAATEWRYPKFQFEPDTGAVIPVVALINLALREDDPIAWWLDRSRTLSARPLEVLATGRLTEAVAVDILTAGSTVRAAAPGSSPAVEVQWVQDALQLRIGENEETIPWETGWRLLLGLAVAFTDSASRPVLPEFWATVNHDAETRCDTMDSGNPAGDQPAVYCGELNTVTEDFLLSSLPGEWQKMRHLLGNDQLNFDIFLLALPCTEKRRSFWF